LSEGEKSESGDELKEKVREACKAVHGEDLERCMEMGKKGAEWLWQKRGGGEKKGLKVITVCNTGSLATSVRPFDLEEGRLMIVGLRYRYWSYHCAL
jgi:methylthioribose-1-phosphate isomerase